METNTQRKKREAAEHNARYAAAKKRADNPPPAEPDQFVNPHEQLPSRGKHAVMDAMPLAGMLAYLPGDRR